MNNFKKLALSLLLAMPMVASASGMGIYIPYNISETEELEYTDGGGTYDFEYKPSAGIGFVFDTTLAAAHLVFSGVVERFPGIRWVLAHLGGTIPYLAERLDRGYYAFSDCRREISKPPSDYLKSFYYDTVNFDVNALNLAMEFAGIDHLLAGSDYPHQIGSLEKMIRSIGALGLSDEDSARILGGNAADLLGL